MKLVPVLLLLQPLGPNSLAVLVVLPLASQICIEDCPKFRSVRTALSLGAMIPEAEHPVSAIDDGPDFAGKGKGDGEAVGSHPPLVLACGLFSGAVRQPSPGAWALPSPP